MGWFACMFQEDLKWVKCFYPPRVHLMKRKEPMKLQYSRGFESFIIKKKGSAIHRFTI
jgi:hypothetical protein